MTLAKLGDVADFIRGITFKPEDVVTVGDAGAVGCMRTKNVQQALDLSDVWGVPRPLVKRDDQLLQEGDILVSSANSWNLIGKCCAVPHLPWQATFGGFVSVLRAHHGKVDSRYLYRWFSSPRIQATVRGFGQQTTNIANLNIERCAGLAVPLPPIPEQRRIADVLDRADAMRAKRREAVGQVQLLERALLVALLGPEGDWARRWPMVALGDICAVKGGKRLPKGEDYSPEPTPFRYIRVADIQDGQVQEDRLVYLRPEIQRAIRNYVVRDGDVVISIAGSIGLVAPVGPSLDGVNLTENAAKLSPNGRAQYAHEYLASLLRLPSVQGQIRSYVGQVTIGKLALFRIEKLLVPLPPLSDQVHYSNGLRAIRRLGGVHLQSAAELDALFASLQHRAFRGEL